MVMTRLDGAYSAVEIGRKKEAEGDVRRAFIAFETAMTDFMHLSFMECSSIEEVKAWVSDRPLATAADRYVAITETVMKMPPSEWPRFFSNGNYLLIAFSHFFAALGQHDRARYLARTAAETKVSTTPFWREYSLVYDAFVAGTTFTPTFGKLTFLEKYLLPYVDLMTAIMDGKSLEPAIGTIDVQFSARIADNRMNDADAHMIEGSPAFPVKFDFRKAGLLTTAENTKLRAIT